MRPRFASWLITLLLAAAAVSGLPATRIAAPCVAYEQVWVQGRNNAAQQQHAEQHTQHVIAALPASPAAFCSELIIASAGLDTVLFQRPPPAVLS